MSGLCSARRKSLPVGQYPFARKRPEEGRRLTEMSGMDGDLPGVRMGRRNDAVVRWPRCCEACDGKSGRRLEAGCEGGAVGVVDAVRCSRSEFTMLSKMGVELTLDEQTLDDDDDDVDR